MEKITISSVLVVSVQLLGVDRVAVTNCRRQHHRQLFATYLVCIIRL